MCVVPRVCVAWSREEDAVTYTVSCVAFHCHLCVCICAFMCVYVCVRVSRVAFHCRRALAFECVLTLFRRICETQAHTHTCTRTHAHAHTHKHAHTDIVTRVNTGVGGILLPIKAFRWCLPSWSCDARGDQFVSFHSLLAPLCAYSTHTYTHTHTHTHTNTYTPARTPTHPWPCLRRRVRVLPLRVPLCA